MIDKKEIKRKYKETVQPMGIYQIRNLINGKVFISSSKNLTGKLNSFNFFKLSSASHLNSELGNDCEKYGEDNFVFEVLDRLEPKEDLAYDYSDDLKTLEELWLEKLQPYGEKGYNKLKK